jgi:hypothetical protein
MTGCHRVQLSFFLSVAEHIDDSGDSKRQGDAHRERMARRSRERTAAASDIGEIPKIKNKRRRNACEKNLFKFLVTYFPHSTGLNPFSDDHKRVIERIQHCSLYGGRFVNAVYRGFAKTTISENSAIWSVLYGHRRCVPIFGNSRTSAADLLDSIKLELETNDLLYEDFPEVCHAIRALEGKPQRCASQTFDGERTYIEWTADRIVFPTIPGSLASGCVIMTRAIVAARGLKQKSRSGENLRPDFVLLDDVQDDESASTAHQVKKRMNAITKSVLKMAGHTKSLAVVMNATVICKEDLVDQLLDQTRNPAWQGERIPMIRQWADCHEDLWLGKYAELRNSYDPDSPGDQKRAWKRATDFYRKNRKKMDAGCQVSWKHCFDPECEISAIQHAYNALIDDGEEAFASEYNQQPMSPEEDAEIRLTPKDVSAKLNRLARAAVPAECHTLTAMIDVHDKLLYWAVVGWAEGFTGYVVDYGTYPEQRRTHFAMRQANPTLMAKSPGTGLEAATYRGLEVLCDQVAGREWALDGGGSMRISRLLIDANYHATGDVVYQFCRQSRHAAILLPSHGKGITASNTPMAEWARLQNAAYGLNWRINKSKGRPVRSILIDTNYWKSFAAARWATAMGDPGCLSLWGTDAKRHQLFAEHICAESSKRMQRPDGRTVDEWSLPPSRPDNHWGDCLVGCCVAASVQGIHLPEHGKTKTKAKRKKRKVSYL